VAKAPNLYARAAFDTDDAVRLRPMLPETDLRPGETFSVFDPRFTTPHAALIAGAEPATVRSWGRKYGLIKWSTHENRNAGVLWSVLDLLFLRMMAVMIEKGISPGDAAWRIGANRAPKEIAMGLVMLFAGLIAEPSAPSVMLFHAGGTLKHPNDKVSLHLVDPKEPIGEVLARLRITAACKEFALIDVRDIIENVELFLSISIFEGPP
jgi:hypothetical protein